MKDIEHLSRCQSDVEVGCEKLGAAAILRDVQRKWGSSGGNVVVLERIEELLRARVSLAEISLMKACGGTVS